MILILGILAGLVQVFGYLVYFFKIKSERIKPNAASWSIWAIGGILESISYLLLTEDLAKNILPITCAISVILIFIYCLYKGKFNSLSKFDYFIITLDIIIIVIWYITKSPLIANILLVITAVISFIPITLNVWRNPQVEDSTAWYLWSLAYLILSFVVILSWDTWEDVIYPITYFILHFLVAILIVRDLFKKKNKILKNKHTLIDTI